ncbi:MAG: type IV pili methyl-accepting chemotaxis transducer N-terminal domain-containing protein [Pseudomonadota bacterium]
MPVLRVTACGLLATALFVFPTQPVAGVTLETAETVRAKIDIAGRQRMLTQRIAKSACMIHQGVDVEHFRAELNKAHKTFSVSFTALIDGKDALGLRPETNSSVLYQYDKVRKAVGALNAAIRPARKGKAMTDADLAQAAEANLTTLQAQQRAVALLARKYASVTEGLGENRAIDFAGAQRMLSQRIAKSYCMVAAGVNVEAHRIALFSDAATFSSRLAQLRDGDATMKIPAPNPEVAAAIAEVETVWAQMQVEIKAMEAHAPTTREGLTRIAEGSEALLKRSQAVVAAMVAPSGTGG